MARRISSSLGVSVFVASLVLTAAARVSAQDYVTFQGISVSASDLYAAKFECFRELGTCWQTAAGDRTRGFWDLWAMGLDCELGLIDCVRHALFGH
jgi:hypothetical protein